MANSNCSNGWTKAFFYIFFSSVIPMENVQNEKIQTEKRVEKYMHEIHRRWPRLPSRKKHSKKKRKRVQKTSENKLNDFSGSTEPCSNSSKTIRFIEAFWSCRTQSSLRRLKFERMANDEKKCDINSIEQRVCKRERKNASFHLCNSRKPPNKHKTKWGKTFWNDGFTERKRNWNDGKRQMQANRKRL